MSSVTSILPDAESSSEVIVPGSMPSSGDSLLQSPLNRRQLLAGGAALFASAFFPYKSRPSTPSRRVSTEKTQESLDEELLGDILLYRNQLGLPGLPSDFSYTNPEHNTLWETPPLFQNNLPESLQSYGDAFDYYSQRILGGKSRALFSTITYDNLQNGFCFYGNSRTLQLSGEVGVSNQRVFPDLIPFFLHEVLGHGTDPQLFDYPSQTKLVVIHGKYRALSQAFKVKGEYFNHENDLTLPAMHKEMGEQLAKKILGGSNLSEVFGEDILSVIAPFLTEVALEQGVGSSLIKFNKSVCRQIGEIIHKKLLGGEIQITDPSFCYVKSMENSLREIYAEMVRKTLFGKGEETNSTIREGVSEVLTAIGGNPNLVKTGLAFIALPTSIQEKKKVEDASRLTLGNDVTNSDNAGTQNTETTVTSLTKEVDSVARQRLSFDSFVSEGQIPASLPVPAEDRVYLESYLMNYSKLCKEYPSLRYSVGKRTDLEFDIPFLHAWQTEELEEIFDTEFVINIFKNGIDTSTSPDLRLRVQKMSELLNLG